MKIIVRYADENTSDIFHRIFYSWNEATPFCEYLHSKHIFLDCNCSFV